MGLDIFNDGLQLLSKEKSLNKDIMSIAKDGKDIKLDPALIKRVGNYVHYYMTDWTSSDPFTPIQSDFKCQIVKPFRKMRSLIMDLRAAGKLDLLKPILSALQLDGIYIDVDDLDTNHKEELNQMISGICNIKNEVDDVTLSRKNLMQEAVETGICTKGCFNEVIKQLYRIEKDSTKIDDALSDIYNSVADNNNDNKCFNEFINEYDPNIEMDD